MAWTLTAIRSKFRVLASKPSTSHISDEAILDLLNNYYQNVFPSEVEPPELRGWYEFNSVASTQTQALPATVVAVRAPVYVAGENATLYTDDGQFFDDYPQSLTTENQPDAILLLDRTLYLGPTPDAVYAIKLRAFNRPDALSVSQDPLKDLWGPVIAYGAAIEHLTDTGDTERANEIAPMYTYYKKMVHSDIVAQIPVGTRAKPRL